MGSYFLSMAIEQNFPSNSDKSKRASAQNEKPKNDPVISSDRVKRQEKSGVEKAKQNFLADDIRDVKNYVVSDVIVPTTKNLIVDIVSKGINMLIFGEDRTSNHKNGSVINYNRLSTGRSDDRRPVARARSTYNYDDLIFDTRQDAEKVFDRLCDIFDQYGQVSVGDLYDAAGQQTLSTDFDWGWTNLHSASVERSRDGGFYIYLPRAVELNRR